MTFQTFTGREYLKIDMANNYGLDKLNWDERLQWFNQNENQLDQLVQSAKEPALFYAGLKAYRDVEAGLPTGYMISLDATSSGLQLLAALTGDRSAAQLCNVVDVGARQDAYQRIYQHMQLVSQDTSKIAPEDVKQAIMTAFYSSVAVPRKVFGEGALLDIFYDTMKLMAPGAWELNEAFLSFWDPTAFKHSWILPDNFHVHINVMNQMKETVKFCGQPFDVYYYVNTPLPEGRSLGANTIHSIDGMIVRELSRRCDYDPARIKMMRHWLKGPVGTSAGSTDDEMVFLLWRHYQETGYLSARILQHLRPANLGLTNTADIIELLDSLPEKPFKVVSIHDCFRCLPHYGNDLRRQYNLQLELIAKSNLLASIIAQLLKQPVKSIQIGKLDPNLYQDIRETNYALS
jgi:hypothetical protein